MIIFESGVSEDVCLRAMHHAASVFKTRLQGGPALYSVEFETALANAEKVLSFGDNMLQIDPTLTLRIGLNGGNLAVMQIEVARHPLYYWTSSLGFTADGEQSFATTVRETIHAWQQQIGPPSFPAPVHPPAV